MNEEVQITPAYQNSKKTFHSKYKQYIHFKTIVKIIAVIPSKANGILIDSEI